MTIRRSGWAVPLRAIALACVVAVGAIPRLAAAEAEPRLALVIGETAYRAGGRPTGANDAGLMAQALAQAGFSVTGYADLPRDALQRAFADFVADAKKAGPEAAIFVYLGGYGVQFDGANFIVPVDARLLRDIDVPAETVPISALINGLEALPLKARIIVADLARSNPFAKMGLPLASGLVLADPPPESLIVYNTAPGAVAAPDQGQYGVFAEALSDAMQARGVSAEVMMARVRSRLNEVTNGSAIPWTGGTLYRSFSFFSAEPRLPARSNASENPSGLLSPVDAYWQAISRDTLQSYAAFLTTYPRDPLARRVVPLFATRREALTWMEANRVNTPPAYWTYMRRYPRGPHFGDARRRLAAIPAPLEPPPRFDPIIFADVPPPRPEELAILDRPFVVFGDEDVPPLRTASLPKASPENRLPPLLPVDAGTLPLPFPVPLSFAHSTGPIVQPGLAGPAGTVIAIDSRDRDGNQTVIQNRADQTILSVATLVAGPSGKRTVTQTGPSQKPVFVIQETTGPHGMRTIVQQGANGQVFAILKTTVDGSGNSVATLTGADAQPFAIVITNPDGRIVTPKNADLSRSTPPRAMMLPTVLQAASPPPKAAPVEAAPPPVPPSPGPASRPPTVATPSGPPLVNPVPPKDVTAPSVPDMKAITIPAIKEPVVPFLAPAEPKRPASPDTPGVAASRSATAPLDPGVPKPPSGPDVAAKSGPEPAKPPPPSTAGISPPVPESRSSIPPVSPKAEAETLPLPPQRPAKTNVAPPQSKAGSSGRKGPQSNPNPKQNKTKRDRTK